MLKILKSAIIDLVYPPKSQNPALDVLRSIAILTVVAFHSLTPFERAKLPTPLLAKFPIIGGGWSGVDLFFVLSGYLIGKQLWQEFAASGTIRIGRFMARRTLRLWPLYYAVLVFAIFFYQAPISKWLSDAVFLSNFFLQNTVPGAWSLCVEEQFYLIAPLSIVLLGRRLKSVEDFQLPLIDCLLAMPLIRMAIYTWAMGPGGYTVKNVDELIYYPIHTRGDGLLMGMLIANLEVSGVLKRWNFFGSWFTPVRAILLGTTLHWVDHNVFNFTGLALVFGSAVSYCLVRPETLPSFVRWPVFFWISRLSYGMYLNHQFMNGALFSLARGWLGPNGSLELLSLVHLTLLTLGSVAVALVTYLLIEYPFLYLREQLFPHKSRASASPPAPLAAVGTG